MSNEHVELLISELERTLPPVIARAKVEGYLGGLMKASYLATLDSEGSGPEGAVRCGRHVGYLRKPFLDWLRKRMTAVAEQRGVRVPSRKDTANALLENLYEYSAK